MLIVKNPVGNLKYFTHFLHFHFTFFKKEHILRTGGKDNVFSKKLTKQHDNCVSSLRAQ